MKSIEEADKRRWNTPLHQIEGAVGKQAPSPTDKKASDGSAYRRIFF